MDRHIRTVDDVLALLDRPLVPGGMFALNCFAAGAMGCELPDADLYRAGAPRGGVVPPRG